jgi:hypothetical protein
MKPARNFWPVGIIVFFTTFFIGMAVVIVIASFHRDTLVSDNYYEQELKFQDQIDATARAEKCGAKIEFDSAGRKIFLTLPAEQAKQIVGGKITLYRANAAELDRQFPLELRGDGTQALDVSKFASGPWRVRVRWNVSGQDYFLEKKIVI